MHPASPHPRIVTSTLGQRTRHGLCTARQPAQPRHHRHPHEHDRAATHAAAHQTPRGHRADVLHPRRDRRDQKGAQGGREGEQRDRADQGQVGRAAAVRVEHERDGQGEARCGCVYSLFTFSSLLRSTDWNALSNLFKVRSRDKAGRWSSR